NPPSHIYLCVATLSAVSLSCILFYLLFFFFHDTAPTEIYTLSLHDALPILSRKAGSDPVWDESVPIFPRTLLQSEDEHAPRDSRSEEHTSELQSRGHLVCRLLLEKKKGKQIEETK